VAQPRARLAPAAAHQAAVAADPEAAAVVARVEAEADAGKQVLVVQAVSVGCISSFLVARRSRETFAGLFFVAIINALK
jgi:predicted alpha/beta hydrolase family esterase